MSAPDRTFHDGMARAHNSLAALNRAVDDLTGLRGGDDAGDHAGTRRRRLLDGLVTELSPEGETT